MGRLVIGNVDSRDFSELVSFEDYLAKIVLNEIQGSFENVTFYEAGVFASSNGARKSGVHSPRKRTVLRLWCWLRKRNLLWTVKLF